MNKNYQYKKYDYGGIPIQFCQFNYCRCLGIRNHPASNLIFIQPIFLLLVLVLSISITKAQVNPESAETSKDQQTTLTIQYHKAFEAMMKDITNPEKSFNFAQIANNSGDTRGTIAALERVLQLQPGLANIELELGILYLRVGAANLAKAYLQRALDSPDIPPWIRNRAELLLARAEQQTQKHLFSGWIFAGGRYDTNANAGPSSQVIRVVGQNALLDERFTDQEDYSGEAIARFQYVYDFESQTGNQLEIDFTSYNRRYVQETQVNTNVLDLDIGPRFFFGPLYDPDFSIKPFFSSSVLFLDDELYLRTLGGGVNFRKQFGLRLLFDITFEADDQKFFDGKLRPFSSLRSGPNFNLYTRVSWQWRPATLLSAGINLSRRDAQTDFEAYDLGSGWLSVTQTYQAPFKLTEDTWSTSLTGSVRHTHYDAPDPFIDPDQAREDTRFDVTLTTSIPLSSSWTIILTGLYSYNDSSLPNFEYDNWGANAGIAFAF